MSIYVYILKCISIVNIKYLTEIYYKKINVWDAILLIIFPFDYGKLVFITFKKIHVHEQRVIYISYRRRHLLALCLFYQISVIVAICANYSLGIYNNICIFNRMIKLFRYFIGNTKSRTSQLNYPSDKKYQEIIITFISIL